MLLQYKSVITLWVSAVKLSLIGLTASTSCYNLYLCKDGQYSRIFRTYMQGFFYTEGGVTLGFSLPHLKILVLYLAANFQPFGGPPETTSKIFKTSLGGMIPHATPFSHPAKKKGNSLSVYDSHIMIPLIPRPSLTAFFRNHGKKAWVNLPSLFSHYCERKN